MMTLPQFDNLEITIEELLAEQVRLHTQADKMLKKTSIADIFPKYGDVSPIGGSYDYGLMVYPDLDMDIMSNQLSKKDFINLANELLSSSFIRKVSCVDNVTFTGTRQGMPKGYWLGIEIPFEGDKWGIDLWLQTHEWADKFDEDFDNYKTKLSGISPEQIASVLSIKYHLIRLGKYGKNGFMSFNVYDAVLEKNVLTLDDFLILSSAHNT
jgi:hypothetical protein